MEMSFFGHLCRADTIQDHSPKNWRRRTGRPRQTYFGNGLGRSAPA